MCRVHFLRLRHKVTEEMVSGTADRLEFMMIEGHVPLEEAWKLVYDAFKRLRSQGDAGHNFKDYAIIDLEFSVYQHGSHGLAEIWQVSVIDLLGMPIAEAFIDRGESERQKAGDGFQQRIRKSEYAAMHDFYQLRTIERKSKGRLPIWTIQELGDKLKKTRQQEHDIHRMEFRRRRLQLAFQSGALFRISRHPWPQEKVSCSNPDVQGSNTWRCNMETCDGKQGFSFRTHVVSRSKPAGVISCAIVQSLYGKTAPPN